MQINNFNQINEVNPKTVLEEKFKTREENLLKIKKEKLEKKPEELKKPLPKNFSEFEFKKPINIRDEEKFGEEIYNGFLPLMLGEDEKYFNDGGIRIKESEIDTKCFKMREKIRVFENVIKEILEKSSIYDSVKNEQYTIKINSMALKLGSLIEVINYIKNLREAALKKYYTFIKKVEEKVGVPRAELNLNIENLEKLNFNKPKTFKNENDEENFNMQKEDLQSKIDIYNRKIDEYGVKMSRIYGVRFKNELLKILEKEVEFLRKIYRPSVFIKDLTDEIKFLRKIYIPNAIFKEWEKNEVKEECEKALEEDINYAVNCCARNIISSYEHLLYASSLDEVKEETRTEELEKLANIYGIHILHIGDPLEL